MVNPRIAAAVRTALAAACIATAGVSPVSACGPAPPSMHAGARTYGNPAATARPAADGV